MATLLPSALVFTSRVITGAGRGKRLKIPTLNLDLASAPPELSHGVYAAWVEFAKQKFQSAMHYGPRPVFKDSVSLEAHLLDADITNPPEQVTVTVIAHLRPVEDFKGPEALKAAIADDIRQTRAILAAQ